MTLSSASVCLACSPSQASRSRERSNLLKGSERKGVGTRGGSHQGTLDPIMIIRVLIQLLNDSQCVTMNHHFDFLIQKLWFYLFSHQFTA